MTIKKNIYKEYETNEEVERYWPQVTAILIGALSGLTEGVNYSWTSPFVVKITEDKVNYDITEEEASLFNTIHPIAFLIGCPIFSKLSDSFGRKRTYMLTAILHILCWIFTILAKDVYLFYISRVCAGLSNACFFAVFPMYVGEIANPTVRGSWGNAIASSMYFGEVIVNVIGSNVGVQETSYIFLPIPIIFLVLFSLMPESPYFYIMKGKEEEAKSALIFLTRKTHIDKDYQNLKKDVDRQLSESANWSDLFKIISNRRALIAGIFLRFSQQASGLGIFLLFTQTIFQKSGANLSRETSSIIFTSSNLITNVFVISFIVHRFSRKKLFIASVFSSGIVLYILGTYFYIDANGAIDLSSFNWIPIASMELFLVCASFGIGVMPSLMMSELFSTSIKAKAMTLILSFMAIGNILVNTSFYYIVEYFGFYSAFYLYAICNSIATVLSIYIIPETKEKTLEQIQQMLHKKI